jgi:uncharacterized protein (TIGR00730 family)
MISSICLFCGSRFGGDPVYREAAARFGLLAARAGVDVVYGGGDVGLMGVAADAATEAGGRVIGFIPARLLEREVGHRGITELVVTASMFERKDRMIGLADAFVVLPGGLGTLDELLEVITLRQLDYHDKPIVVVDTGGFFRPFVALIDRVVAAGFATPSCRRLFEVVDDVDEAFHTLGIAEAPPSRAAAGE